MKLNPFNSEQRSYTNQEAYMDFINTTDTANRYVGIEALNNSDVFTGVKIIATDIASNPLYLKTSNGDTVTDVDILHLLNTKPNNYMTAFSFKFALIANLILCGESFAVIVRDNGVPVSLELLLPSEVTVYLNANNELVYEISTITNKPLPTSSRIVESRDILHFKYFTTDGLRGLSPLSALQQELSMVDVGNRTILSSLKKGVVGSGILKVRNGALSVDAKTKIREDFESMLKGSDSLARTIILDDTMQYTPLEVSTEVLKLINSNTWQTKQIAKALGLPLDRFGMELVNTSTEETNHNYVKTSLSGYITAFTSELNSKLLTDNSAMEVDTTAITRPPQVKQWDMALNAVEKGVISVDEARQMLGYNSLNTEESTGVYRTPSNTSKEVN